MYWQEDITDITALLEKLEENKETIAESNHLEQENYRIKLEIHTLREKNRLYDLLQEETAHQIDLLNDLFYLYDEEENPEKRRSLLAKITVIGAYIKRRGNLIFIREKTETIDTTELAPVSYTHLDVYKRQLYRHPPTSPSTICQLPSRSDIENSAPEMEGSPPNSSHSSLIWS